MDRIPPRAGARTDSFNFDGPDRSRAHSTASNPFDTPTGYATPVQAYQQKLATRYFKSRRKGKEEIPKPWLAKKDPRQKWLSIFPLLGVLLGFAVTGAFVWEGLRTVRDLELCMVYEDSFSNGINTDVWTQEAEVGGYGNGQFEETTTTDENIFVKDNVLYIKPTLQDESLIETNNVINLTASGLCTGTEWDQCVTSTNTTNGTIVNPVKSGRLSTKPRNGNKGASIKYGRVEVRAKLPAGDWLWPAIWMLPVEDTYGLWPASGEIDIVESRGNNYSYKAGGGNDIATSTIHWGPDTPNDAWWRTHGRKNALHSTFTDKFHTFGLEWTDKYLFTYIDTRLMQVLYTKFRTPLWERGDFPLSDTNGTAFVDPWSQTGRPSTPFDQPFYLILNVAVGGSNGWFTDGKGNKPWVNDSPSARVDFWKARDKWYPTWEENGQLVVESVKIWQLKGYQGC